MSSGVKRTPLAIQPDEITEALGPDGGTWFLLQGTGDVILTRPVLQEDLEMGREYTLQG